MLYIICGKAFLNSMTRRFTLYFTVYMFFIYGYMPCQNLQFKSTEGERNLTDTFYN